MNLTAIFGKFAGREVPMAEKEVEYDFDMLGKMTLTEIAPANPNDPTIAEMEKVAKQNGLTLRVWWPGIVGTMDCQPNRVNVGIVQSADGKWRIDNDFKIG